ncbi:MAG: TonB C-terminal domain-containing protein [Proteobacteria bacterium]|nr:TonB C-terminal domain-containing protein [Pseudomonadota bacterium]
MDRHPRLRRHRVPMPAPSRTAISVGGLAASLLLHGLLFTPLMWGGHHPPRRMPDEVGAAASHQADKAAESMLIVFEEDASAIHDTASEDESDPRFILPQPPILPIARAQLPTPQLSALDEPDDTPAAEADGDQSGRSMMFGRYMGQISARVERAWQRPRSIPPQGSFACRVQITQDRRGYVQEVTLERCTEDPRWQVSLVRAIEGSSPFPAPPDPAVFSNLITLEFDSDAYVAGSGGQGFEPAPPHPVK